MPQAAFAIVDLIPDQPADERLTDASEAPELARVLFEASPADAKAFALSMHERAAWGQNVDLIELWSGVVMELTHIAGASRPASNEDVKCRHLKRREGPLLGSDAAMAAAPREVRPRTGEAPG